MKRKQQMFRLTIAGIFLTLPLLGGCASLEREAQDVAEASERTLTIQNVWARSEDAGQNSAVYLEIVNRGEVDDQLIAAETDVAGVTEVHEVVSRDNVMRMQEVEQVEIPAGETVNLEPGGYHLMLFGLVDDLDAGDEFDVSLTFDRAGEITVTAEVRHHTPDHGYRDPGQGGL